MNFLPSKTDRDAFGKIAGEYDLVYFGRVDPREDTDYTQVGGITISPRVVDENYTTGNVYDYEIEFLQRSRKIQHLANGQETAATRWDVLQNTVKKTLKKTDYIEVKTRKRTILQVTLKQAHLPHIFVCGRIRLPDYITLINIAERWQEIGWQNLPSSTQTGFPQMFATFITAVHIAWLPYILSPEVQAMLVANFAEFDYEIFDNKLLVYTMNDKIDLDILDHMLRIGLWWARGLDVMFAAQVAASSVANTN